MATKSKFPTVEPQTSTLARIYKALEAHGCEYGGGQDFTCPAHEDDSASCGIIPGKKRAVIIKCQAGCDAGEVLEALDLPRSLLKLGPEEGVTVDLSHAKPMRNSAGKRKDRGALVGRKRYPYVDADGTPLYDKLRFQYERDKFVCYAPPGATQAYGMPEGIDHVLYRFDKVREVVKAGGRVLYVEGEKDVESFEALGLRGWVATTAGSSEDWQNEFADEWVGAREVVVVADNDEAGFLCARRVQESAEARNIPWRVLRAALDTEHADLSDHLAAGLTMKQLVPVTEAELDEHAPTFGEVKIQREDTITSELSEGKAEVEDAPEKWSNDYWPAPGDNYGNALRFYEQIFRDPDTKLPTMRYWRDMFYEWDGECWKPYYDETMEKFEYEVLRKALTLDKDGNPVPWAPNPTRIKALNLGLRAATHIERPVNPGCLLSTGERPPWLAMRNNVLDIHTRQPVERTPDFFNFICLPYDYDADAQCPKWLQFLDETWEGDPEAIALLQEWFGYVVSGDTKHQKMLWLIGASGSGKTTIETVLRALVGLENTAAPTLGALSEDFGLAPLVQKTLAVVGDARFSGGRQADAIMEKLLNIVGNGEMQVNRKNKDHWMGQLPARFMVIANELPELKDNSGAFMRRTLLLETNARPAKVDLNLPAKLIAEAPGVLNWALAGLDRLNAAGRFSEVASSRELLRDFEEQLSIIKSFANERLEFGTEFKVTDDALHAEFANYCSEQGRLPLSKGKFTRQFGSTYPRETDRAYTKINGKSARVWRGVRVQKRAVQI